MTISPDVKRVEEQEEMTLHRLAEGSQPYEVLIFEKHTVPPEIRVVAALLYRERDNPQRTTRGLLDGSGRLRRT